MTSIDTNTYAHTHTYTLGLWFSAESNIFLFFLSIHLLSLQGSGVGGGRRQFICHDFQRRRLTLPPLSLTAALLATREKQPPHEFGPCSPRGGAGGQLSFTIAPMTPEIFLSVINLINILIMTWGWQSNQIARCPVTGPRTLHFGDKFSQVSGAVIQEAGTSYQRWAHSRDNFLCVIIKWWLSDGEQLPFYSRNILTLFFVFFFRWNERVGWLDQTKCWTKGTFVLNNAETSMARTAAARKKHDSFSLVTHWVRGAELGFFFLCPILCKISLTFTHRRNKTEDWRYTVAA